MPVTVGLNTVGVEVLNVRDPRFGAVGDGAADDTAAIQAAADLAFGTAAAPHATSAWLNRPLYFPPGRYRVTGHGVAIPKITGARIFGDARFAARIANTAGGSVFRTNGFQYSEVAGLSLSGTGAATVFDLDYDGEDAFEGAHQGNTFRDIYTEGGAIGWNVGAAGFMGSENIWINCHAGDHKAAGYKCSNANALQNTLVGGNIQNCGKGVWMNGGSFTVIESVGFQLSAEYDVQIDYSAYDSVDIIGCRSESTNFLNVNVAPVMVGLTGISHLSQAHKNGELVRNSGGAVRVERAYSTFGGVRALGAASMEIADCRFGRADWFASEGLTSDAHIERKRVVYGFLKGQAAGRVTHDLITKSGAYDYGPAARPEAVKSTWRWPGAPLFGGKSANR